MRVKLKKRREEKKEEEETRTKGSWFNIIFCFLAFFFVLLVEGDFILVYYNTILESTLFSYLVFLGLILCTLVFLAVLAQGFIFNMVSKRAGHYPKNSLYLKLDIWIDKFLWWAITMFGLGLFLINVLIVECMHYTCI